MADAAVLPAQDPSQFTMGATKRKISSDGDSDVANGLPAKRPKRESPTLNGTASQPKAPSPVTHGNGAIRSPSAESELARTEAAAPTSVPAPAPVETQAASQPRQTPKPPVEPLGPWVYAPGELLPDLEGHVDETFEVHIQPRHLTTANDQVANRQVWGSGIYTDDSDVVAAVVHSGLYTPTDGIPEMGMVVTLRVMPHQANYPSSSSKLMRSRSWQGHEGLSFKIVSVVRQKIAGKSDQKYSEEFKEAKLEAWRKDRAARARARRQKGKERRGGFGDFLADVSVLYNVSNDPCLKYTPNLIADRGTDPQAWTSNRLRSEALYLETARDRYELSVSSVALTGDNQTPHDKYRWARVVNSQQLNRQKLETLSIPLSSEHVEVIESNLEWSEITWTPTSVIVRNTPYELSRVFWMPSQ